MGHSINPDLSINEWKHEISMLTKSAIIELLLNKNCELNFQNDKIASLFHCITDGKIMKTEFKTNDMLSVIESSLKEI